jgi:hypothetical protein
LFSDPFSYARHKTEHPELPGVVAMSETPLANVYVSGRFAGSILLRDWSFEAIDARDCAIGMFTSQREAAAALQEVDMKSATVAQTVPSKPVFAKA